MLAYAQTQWMIVDETSDEDDEETPPLGLTPAMSRGGMAAIDSDVVVGGETSSEGELSGDDASEVGETTSGGGVAMTPAIQAYEMQTLTYDGGGVETASEASEIEQQPRRGRGRRAGQAARRRVARARERAPGEAAPLPADGSSDDSSGRDD